MIKSRIFRQTLTLGFCITLIASASAEANEALIKPPQEIQRLRNDITGTVGNTFAAFNRRIDMLGVYDAGGDGLKNPHQVALWTIGDELLASVTVPAGTEAELIDGYRYVKLSKAVTLPPGAYRIGAFFRKGGDPFPTSNDDKGYFLPGDGVRLDNSVVTHGNDLALPTNGRGREEPGVWTRAARWAPANALTRVEKAAPKPVLTNRPARTPQIELAAEFVDRTRYAMFDSGEKVRIWVEVSGRRLMDEGLEWSVLDWRGELVDRGEIQIPTPEQAREVGFYSMTYKDQYRDWIMSRPARKIPPWENVLEMPDYGSGYFAVHMKLKKSGVTLPRLGTRPEGMISYAVKPAIRPVPLEHVDDSRFGAQGFAFVDTGEVGRGNMVAPLYPETGLKWIYGYRRPGDIRLGDYHPNLNEAKTLFRDESGAGLCLLLTCTGFPADLMDAPEGVTSFPGGSYPPKDFNYYESVLGKIAKERALVKQSGAFPTQKKNYYEITWEPDWHWRGSDEQFIKIYEHAYRGIHANDPDGMLLGAKYGVLPRGVAHLERLLPQGLANYLDGISTHAYCSWPDRVLRRDIRKVVSLARQYLKPGAPVIQSEVGSRDTVDWPGSPDPYRTQMAYDLRAHLIILGEGVDTSLFFYLTDHGAGGAYGLYYNLNDPNPTFGPTHVSPKPVGAAFAAMIHLLEGTETLRPLDYLGEEIFCYTFKRDDQILSAIWAADMAGSCEESQRQVRIPIGTGEVSLFDPMGNETAVQSENGFVNLTIGAEPVYLLGLSDAVVPDTALNLSPGQVIPGMRNPQNISLSLFAEGKERPLKPKGDSFVLPGDIGNGQSLLIARDNETGAWIQAATVDVIPTFTLAKDDAEADLGAFTVSNNGDDILEGTFEILPAKPKFKHNAGEALQVPEKGAKPLFAKSLRLPAGEKIRVVVDAVDLTPYRGEANAMLAQFTDTAGRLLRIKAGELKGAAESYTALPLTQPPTIDGQLRDWKLELFKPVTMTDEEQASRVKWQGNADLSYRWAAQYDEKALYLAVKVYDQSHVQEVEHWRSSWREDCLQFAIGVHPYEEGTTENVTAPGLNATALPAKLGYRFFHEFCLALKGAEDNGLPMLWRFEGPAPFPKGDIRGKAQFAIKRMGAETNYELALPWSELDAELKSFPESKQLGFTISVNDIDIIKGFKNQRKAIQDMGWLAAVPKLGTLKLE
jgi:hypothetical protein